MGTKLTQPRKHMSKMELFQLMKWLDQQDQAVLLTENMLEIRARAIKELSKGGPKLNITDHGVRSSMDSLGLKCCTSKISNTTETEQELLARIKLLEKFVSKYFAEEWANL